MPDTDQRAALAAADAESARRAAVIAGARGVLDSLPDFANRTLPARERPDLDARFSDPAAADAAVRDLMRRRDPAAAQTATAVGGASEGASA